MASELVRAVQKNADRVIVIAPVRMSRNSGAD
jgi:hypothetical protein